MDTQIYLRVSISIVLTTLFMTGFYAYTCPSPPVMYAAEGDNITLCWSLLPTVANASNLKRFTVMALKRPAEAQMKKVASANKDGTSGLVYQGYDYHDDLYVDRASVVADFLSGMLFLRLTNYTSKIQNIYCVLYEMFGPYNVPTCHSQAVFLRDIGSNFPRSTEVSTSAMGSTSTTESTSAMESTSSTVTNKTERTEIRRLPPTNSPRAARSEHTLIILSYLLGVMSILAVVGFVLFCQARKSRLS